MQDIAWLFNSDFEQHLFRNQFQHFESTKMTQEFEYLIHLLDPSKILYSKKKYSTEYLSYIEGLTGEEIKCTQSPKEIVPWCSNYEKPELLKKFQHKENTIKFLLDKNLIKEKIKFVKLIDELEEGYLYKYSKSLSGGGHYQYPKDKIVLEKMLNNNETLIKETLHSRVLDFSSLIIDGKVVCTYENSIDQYFQYKGTVIDNKFKLPISLNDRYQDTLKEILNYTKEYRGIFSMDSYLYNRDGEVELFPCCELNMRKTMGYAAYSLKNKYFQKQNIFKFLLVKNKPNSITYSRLKKIFDKDLLLLSPLDNRFLVFGIAANSGDQLKEKEDRLLSTFF